MLQCRRPAGSPEDQLVPCLTTYHIVHTPSRRPTTLHNPQALAEVDTLREYETALMGEGGAAAARGMGLAEHAFQTAEV